MISQMKWLFFKYYFCIFNISRNQWLMNNIYSKFKLIWIKFDEYDERMNYSQIKDDYNEIYELIWYKKISIHENYFWNITYDDIMNDEKLKREREYLMILLNQ